MKDYYFYHMHYGINPEIKAHGIAFGPEKTDPRKIMSHALKEVAKGTETNEDDWTFTAFNFLRTI